MIRFTFIFILILSFEYLSAQKQDYLWFIGHEPYDIVLPERAADTTRGATNMDFGFEPPKFYYDPKRFLDFWNVNSSVCDSKGRILAYTNGQVIYNQFNKPIADTINYSADWEYTNYGEEVFPIPGGLSTTQGALILPVPGDSSLYYTFYTTRDRENPPYMNFQISYAKINVDSNNINGTLIEKDIVLLQDSLSGSITAVRHGNGRDWWLIAPRRIGNVLNIWLIDPMGINYKGRLETGLQSFHGVGQIYLSPDGQWISWYVGGYLVKDGGQLFLAKFDRCSGTISNPSFIYIDISHFRFAGGVSFSYDSRYLYMCNKDFIYQYDLEYSDVLESQTKVATFDGFTYTFPYDKYNPIKYPVNFYEMYLAPDGRIYITPNSATTRMLSVMHFPQKQGKECDVRQHSVLMPTGFARGLPNFPDYRLGALDGSACDTLNIDNIPVAKYRYEVDTNDYLSLYFTDLSYSRPESWSWDFGDYSYIELERYPTHHFPKNGTYNVCLTVSNENSQDKKCKTITIGSPNPNKTEESISLDIRFFPNPVTDYLQITLGDFVPQSGNVTFYDISGKVVLEQNIHYGQNMVDLGTLDRGFYTCIIKDNKTLIRTEKILKL